MLAFTFPGQGSLRPGMGRVWLEHPSWELVQDASDVVGRDIGQLLCDAGMAELAETRNAQLATFTLSLVVLDAVERLGVEPSICAGHSLGEYTALAASGAIGFEEGLRLVAERGEAMQDVADNRPGKMSALLGVSDDDAEVACQRAENEVWVANYNAPGQVVIAGTEEGVDVAIDVARSMGMRKAVTLAVRGPFHTPLMAPARQRLRKALAEVTFDSPGVPVLANVDAKAHADPAEWPGLLSTQLCSPVRWRHSLVNLHDDSSDLTMVELGGGGVLTGLARRTLPGVRVASVASPSDLDAFLQSLADGADMASQGGTGSGEHLYVSERIVVSPATGTFEPEDRFASLSPGSSIPSGEGLPLAVGDQVGKVGAVDVRSAFAGRLVGLLAHRGERVVDGQPVAWLRSSDSPA